MANTTYRELADAFFNKVKDYSFLEMSEEMAYDIVISYIRPAIVNFQSAKQDLSDRDDILQEFGFTLSDETFVLLTNYLVLEYLDANYLKTSTALKSRLTSSDFKSLGLNLQLGKVMELHEMLKSENDQLAINKSYKDSKLFDLVVNRKKV